MIPRRESTPGQMARGTFSISPTCTHHTAKRKAEALELNAAALAEGIWPVTPPILDALARLAAAVVWDLEMVP